MKSIKQTILVPYTTRQMYDLINEIESYPLFLPFCRKAVIHSQTIDEIRASIEVAKGAFQYTFTTTNRLQAHKIIEMRLHQGPFKRLEGFWQFDQIGEEGSRVTLDLEYQFANKLFDLAFNPFIPTAIKMVIHAFQKRAQELYSNR